MDGIKPSALPPVDLIIEDRDHITVGRVTHSERVRSVRHCMVTNVIGEDHGWYTVRWVWYFLLLHTRCSIFWHVVTRVPEELLSFPAGYTSELLLAAVWRSGCGSARLASHLSVSLDRRYRRKACSQAPPCPMFSLTHKQTQLLLWQGLHTGIYQTAVACHSPWQRLPAFSGDRQAGWTELKADCAGLSGKHALTSARQSGGNCWTHVTR